MFNYYFHKVIQFAHTNSFMFVFIVISIFLALSILIILLLNPKKNQTKMAQYKPINTHKPDSIATTQDIRAIAGDDIVVTQLDLARAYIELGKKEAAKQILEMVKSQGSPNQQVSAQEILSTL